QIKFNHRQVLTLEIELALRLGALIARGPSFSQLKALLEWIELIDVAPFSIGRIGLLNQQCLNFCAIVYVWKDNFNSLEKVSFRDTAWLRCVGCRSLKVTLQSGVFQFTYII